MITDSNRQIIKMPPELAGKIAAGEVVERPLSIVKELVENSIDAGATSLTVEIKEGGKSYIRVTDNGCGIPKDQLELAFTRYATSKIRTQEDLAEISTLGFRGEALASVAAVSRVELLTKTFGARTGSLIKISGSVIETVSDAACDEGTTIVVRDLFYNTPARMKFLKSDNSESSLIIDFVSKIALAFSGVKIRLISNGTILFSTPGRNDVYQSILTVYSPQMARSLMQVSGNEGNMKLSGYSSMPSETRTNRRWQVFFVNGRLVKSKLLENAVSKAYSDRLFEGRFPICFVFLSLPPESLDVNVHPHKTEIRFYDEKSVEEFVAKSIRTSLLVPESLNVKGKQGISPYVNTSKETVTVNNQNINDKATEYKTSAAEAFRNTADKQTAEENNISKYSKSAEISDSVDIIKLQSTSPKEELFSELRRKKDSFEQKVKSYDESLAQKSYNEPSAKYSDKESSAQKSYNESSAQNYEKKTSDQKSDNKSSSILKSTDPSVPSDEKVQLKISDITPDFEKPSAAQLSEKPLFENDAKARPQRTFFFEKLKPIGTAFDTYIVAKDLNSVYIIDQHAAHERVMYEKLKSSFYRSEKPSQLLITPIVIELDNSQAAAASDIIPELNAMGFEADEFGPSTVAVKQIPAFMDLSEANDFLSAYFEGSRPGSRASKEDLMQRACKSAVKARDVLSYQEITALFRELDLCENPFSCPHGRPVFLRFTEYELERMFKRK